MYVCFIANPNIIHTERWISALAQSGITTELLAYRKPTKLSYPCRVIDISQPALPGMLKWLLYSLRSYLWMRIHKPDIVHSLQVQPAGWVGALANYQPLVCSAWGSDLLLVDPSDHLRYRLTLLALRQSTSVIVPTQVLYKRALSLNVAQEKIKLIPWALEWNVFFPDNKRRNDIRQRYGISSTQHIILCPRRISPLMNLDILLDAFVQLRHRNENALLFFLAYNPDPAHLQWLSSTIQERQLSRFIRILPPANNLEEMADFYRMADIVVSIPSSEGYGFSIFEAIACGTPTVITDLPVFQDQLTHQQHTLKVPVRDIASTTYAIQSLCNDSKLRDSIAQTAIANVQQYSVNEMADSARQLYQDLVSGV